MDEFPPSLTQPMQNSSSNTLSAPLSLGKILKSKSRGEKRGQAFAQTGRAVPQGGLCSRLLRLRASGNLSCKGKSMETGSPTLSRAGIRDQGKRAGRGPGLRAAAMLAYNTSTCTCSW